MAKISVGLYFPTLSQADLRALVVAHDASNDRSPITPENVTAADIMQLWFSGEFPNVTYEIGEIIED